MFFVFPIFSLSMDSYLVCIWSKSDRSTFGATPRKLGWFSQWLPCMSTLQDLQLVWGHDFRASRFRKDFPYRDVWRSNLIRTNRIWSNVFFSYTQFLKKKIYRYTNINIYIYWYVMYVCCFLGIIYPSLPCTDLCVQNFGSTEATARIKKRPMPDMYLGAERWVANGNGGSWCSSQPAKSTTFELFFTSFGIVKLSWLKQLWRLWRLLEMLMFFFLFFQKWCFFSLILIPKNLWVCFWLLRGVDS